jgi:hypothetical protein
VGSVLLYERPRLKARLCRYVAGAVVMVGCWTILSLGFPAAAADAATLHGHVRTPDGRPVAAAAVILTGPSRATTVSDDRGDFSVGGLSDGTYSLSVVKAGFDRLERDDVTVGAGEGLPLDAALTPSSFSSLQTIGRTSTNVPGRSQINTTTAAVQTISAQAFVDQGSLQVTQLLQEAPGVSLTSNAAGGGSNHASLGAPEYPQIRGALYYETESLIDGHPASVGASRASRSSRSSSSPPSSRARTTSAGSASAPTPTC